MEFENLKFSALLHDIGKFYQRTGASLCSDYEKYKVEDFGTNGAHAKWSHEFISNYWNKKIANLAFYHHNPNKSYDKNLGSIIQVADHHSSGERINLEKGEHNEVLKTLLISVFSEISIENNKKCNEKYVPLTELRLDESSDNESFDDLKPQNEEKMSGWNLKPEYNKLWNKFTKEINGLSKKNDFNTILALLKKYTSTIPSAAYVSKSDISLFDHSKTTAAIATSRYLYKRDSENKLKKTVDDDVYIIINGDISGIQNFIFKVSSPKEAQSGMSKRLRGRSLYLTLLCDAIASHIVEELELTEANILFCGGGRFTIIGPNTDKAKNKLSEIKDTINKEFINKFNAELYLALVLEECNGEDLSQYGDVTRILSNKLAEDKKHKFIDNLEDVFSLDDEVKYEDLCSVCGNPYEKKDEETICDECKSHERLGQKAANADYMIKIYSKENKYKFKKKCTFFEKLNIGYLFKNESSNLAMKIDEWAIDADKIEVIKLNNTDFLTLEGKVNDDLRDKISFSFSFLGNVVPNLGRYSEHKYMPLYFEHLAKISRGSDKLGVLKMDVDNLGRIFSEGLSDSVSISRISTLSSQMDMFFSGFVNNIASQFKVYSNVNDIEDWKSKFKDIKLELQDDFNDDVETVTIYKLKYGVKLSPEEEFNLEKYEIPTIHINYSGGDDLLVLGPYDDIILFAEELRNKFKEWTCNNPSINLSAGINIVSPKFPIGKAAIMSEDYLETSKSCGRNKITLFGEVVNWDSTDNIKGFEDIFEFCRDLEKNCENKNISKGFIYSMLHLWQNSYEYKGLANNPDKWEEDVVKRLQIKRYVPLFKYKLRLIKNRELKEDIDKKGLKFMPWIKIPVSWISLRMR